MSYIYVPSRAKILDKLCLIASNKWENKISAKFSTKIKAPPQGTINIVKNSFSGRAKLNRIGASQNGNLHSSLSFFDIIKGQEVVLDLSGWAINELIMSGKIGKGGEIEKDTEFVAVTYSSHYSLILKDGACYNKITK